MIKHIIYPSGIITTPRRLKEELNARYLSSRITRHHNPSSTLFLSYARESVHTTGVATHPTYVGLSEFYRSSKLSQRKKIGLCGVGVPASATRGSAELETIEDLGHGFVCRPFNHRGGQGWRHVSTPHEVGNEEYVSPIFPKYREYRLIYVLGEPIIVLRKRPVRDSSERIDPTVPWNHAQGSSFVTVNEASNDYTLQTSLREDLENVLVLKQSDIVGIDVMLDRHNNYQVCEFNTCPALTLDNNIEKVKEHVQLRFSAHREHHFSQRSC